MFNVSNITEWALIQSRLLGMTSAGIVKYCDTPQPTFFSVSPVLCGSDDIGLYQEKPYTKKVTIDPESPTGFGFQVIADLTRFYLLEERDAEEFCLSRVSTSDKKDGIFFACQIESFQIFNQVWDSDYSDLLAKFQNLGMPEFRTLSKPIRYIPSNGGLGPIFTRNRTSYQF